MKLLVICQYYTPEPFRISDICETLVKKGHEVTVLTGLPNYPEGRVLAEYRCRRKRKEVLNGVTVIRSYEIGRGKTKINLFLNYMSFSFSASLKALFLKEKFDVVFVNQLSPILMGIPGIVYKKKHKKKLLLYCLDLWPASLAAGGIKKDSIIYKIFLKISRWIYRSADSILVTSSMFKDYFEYTLNIDSKKINHLPQYAEDVFIGNVRKVKNDRYNFVFAGNIGDMQSVETIIKAANELQQHSNIIFHIVGDGSKLENCKVLTNNFGLSNVIYHGRRPVYEMPKYYSLADAMLITLKDNATLSFTLPGKIQSYMAAKKPIIGSINGETKRVIQESGCGLCCVPEDYKELARLILYFCECDEKSEMSKRSYNYYVENYSKEKCISRLESTLLNLKES